MSHQTLFLFGLYAFGIYFGLLFKRQLPCALIGAAGFLWGALFWVVGGIVLLVTKIPYTPASMLIIFILLGLGIGIGHARRKTWRLSRRELVGLLLSAAVFLLALLLASQFNFSTTSQDSIAQLFTGRRIAYEGLSSGVIEELSLRGVFLSQLQSAGVFLGEAYLYAALPAFAVTFVLVFFFLSRRMIDHLLPGKRLALALALLSSLALFSTYFILFQFFYIHNSLISAVYLFVAACAYWLAVVEGKQAWLVFGILGLVGFSLARNEAPLFALIFLVLAVSSERIPYRVCLWGFLPYLGLVIFWYGYLLARMGEGTKILDPEKTLLIIGIQAAAGVLVLISQQQWIKRRLLPHLPRIMLGCLALLLVYMAIQRPDHMILSLWITIRNTFESGGWGITWFFYALLLVLSLAGPRVDWEELFSYGISAFALLLLAIVYFRNPYRLGWGDSANRMLTHILPIIILYVSLKAAQALSSQALPVQKSKAAGDRDLVE